jgi:hypothetical protein
MPHLIPQTRLLMPHLISPAPRNLSLSALLTSRFPLLTSHFCHFPLLTSHFPLPTSHFPLLPLPTSHFPLPTSHFPLPTCHLPLAASPLPPHLMSSSSLLSLLPIHGLFSLVSPFVPPLCHTVRYRPAYTCKEFIDAYATNSYELWHPVKAAVPSESSIVSVLVCSYGIKCAHARDVTVEGVP